ncbi:MAG: class I SAM-dependent methyltransferase [Myxococcota bacterium]
MHAVPKPQARRSRRQHPLGASISAGIPARIAALFAALLLGLPGALQTACTTRDPQAPADSSASTSDSTSASAPASTPSPVSTSGEAPAAGRPEGLPENINAPFLAPDLAIDDWIERFEGESRAVYAHREAIVAALGLAPGSAIADIGAGTGFFTALFDAAVGPGGRVHAVEISPGFLAHLRARAKREALSSVEVVEGNERSIELPPASIDVAFLCDVYHHFEHPAQTLASIRSALRPGGTLVLIDFERIPGVTSAYLLGHVRAGREVFSDEIVRAGFRVRDEIELEGLEDNYILRFTRAD